MTFRMEPNAATKLLAFGLLFSCCAAAQDKAAVRTAQGACGPMGVRFKIKGDRSQHPAPPPENGKARLYLMGDATFAVDGQWVGATTEKTYFYMSLDPGVHHLCIRSSHWLPYADHSRCALGTGPVRCGRRRAHCCLFKVQ